MSEFKKRSIACSWCDSDDVETIESENKFLCRFCYHTSLGMFIKANSNNINELAKGICQSMNILLNEIKKNKKGSWSETYP